MSSLVLTIDDSVEAEVAALTESAELEFEMGDISSIDAPSTQSNNQAINNRKRKAPDASFLKDLVDYSNVGAEQEKTIDESTNQPITQRARRDILYERAQDRLAMRKFHREQRRERGEHVSDSEEDEPVKEEDSQSDDESTSQSTKQSNDSEQMSDDDDEPVVESGPAPVIVAEWHGTKKQMLAIKDFGELVQSRLLLRALADIGFTRPTPVQSAVIPHALAGRDLLANAMTGSGKTAAFILPILERLMHRNKREAVTRVLVLLPTRELAVQCQQMTISLARYTDVRTCLVVGGLSESEQLRELQQRPEIVIGTPGRLIDHLRNAQGVDFPHLEVLVLDEADRLLELGFIEEMREILRLVPKERQTLLFSATLSSSVNELIDLSLKDPMKISIDSNQTIVDSLTQEFVRLRRNEPGMKSMQEREALVFSLIKRNFSSKTLIFVPTKDECHRLFLLFSLSSMSACELSGSLTQLQRMEALDAFKKNRVNVLICTDLASRGLDILGVETVINMTMPADLKTYIHRVGRTARAGRSGRSITLVGRAERKQVKTLVSRSNDRVHARIVPEAVVRAEMERLEKLEEDVNEMLEEEKMEKEHRVAEAEVNRAKNKLIHEEEIQGRPKKTWFQSEQDKLASKLASVRNFDTQALLTGKLSKKPQKEVELVDEDGRPMKKKKEDPLRGLSREAKRRKLMRMEAEKEAAERRAAREAGEDVERSVNPRALAHHAKKALRTKYEDEDAHGSMKKPKPLRVVPVGLHLANEDESVDKRYRIRARTTAKANKLAELEKQRHKPSKGGAFKSKSKHKRK